MIAVDTSVLSLPALARQKNSPYLGEEATSDTSEPLQPDQHVGPVSSFKQSSSYSACRALSVDWTRPSHWVIHTRIVRLCGRSYAKCLQDVQMARAELQRSKSRED